MFRLLIRLIVLALAAVGAKSLYDKLAPRADKLKSTGGDLVDHAASATRTVGKSVTEAAQRVVDTAKTGADDVKTTAVDAANDIATEAKHAASDAQANASAPANGA